MFPKGTNQQRIHRIRAAMRYQTDGIHCGEGTLQDLSESGMRFEVPAKPPYKIGHVQSWSIASATQRLNLNGRVVWVRKQDMFGKTHQIGVQFVNVKPAVAKAIEQFAIHGFVPKDDDKASEKSSSKAKPKVNAPDLYGLLGVEPGISQEKLRAAYHKLAKTTHPDVCDEPGAAERFDMITKAYEVLGDPSLRYQYDQRYGGAA